MKRRIAAIEYSDTFLRHLSRLPQRIIEQAAVRERIFKDDAFDLRLKTHKLHGKDKDYWAFWINYHYRIKFLFLDNTHVLFLDVGTHDNVY